MQATLRLQHAKTVTIRAERRADAATSASRRTLLAASVVGFLAQMALKAEAKDIEEAQREREARRAALRAAAGSSKNTGRDAQVFQQPEYSLSEDARTPNFHTRQNEGARKQENV